MIYLGGNCSRCAAAATVYFFLLVAVAVSWRWHGMKQVNFPSLIMQQQNLGARTRKIDI